MKRFSKLLTGALAASAIGTVGVLSDTQSASAASLIGNFSFEGPIHFNANSFDFNAPAPLNPATGNPFPSPGIEGVIEVTASTPGLAEVGKEGTIKDLCTTATGFACDDGIAETPLPVTDFLTFVEDDGLPGDTFASFTLNNVIGPVFTPLGGSTSVAFEVVGQVISSTGDISKALGIISTQVVNNTIFTGPGTLEDFITANPDDFFFASDSGTVSLTAVPEPTTIIGTSLFLAGAASSALKKKKKSKAQKAA